ncbi:MULTISPECIES: sensor histidine kinase [Bacillus cereus group]|uniref:GHKL domain-containing protein n=1 Tax=Bacillus paramobilis TaxID=2817477 RepID=A0ABZ2VL38_9BACI|nr:GHKL domain-containing protein [Bacillus cereus]
MSTFGVLFVQFLITIVSLKIISNVKKRNILEGIVILVISLIGAISYIEGFIYASIILILFTYCMSYFYQREIIHSLMYGSYALIVVLISDHISSYLDTIILGYLPNIVEVEVWIHLLSCVLMGIFISILVQKVLQKLSGINIQLKLFMAFIGVSTVFVYYTLIFAAASKGNTFELIRLNLFFFFMYLFLSIVTVIIYFAHLKKLFQEKRKEEEYDSLKKYLNEIEIHYQNMRKFKHDYQNILLSIEMFILEKDMQGLKGYFEEILKPTSKYLDENNFKLENLSKIKLKELKSIFASKLMRAQELGINARFEANAEIEKLPIDSFALITSVGILLDNAIEEIECVEYEYSELLTGVIKDGDNVSIIIQNTCRDNTPRLHLLKKIGFSTKGEGRGLGLNNLQELLAPLTNVTTETTKKNNLFVQKIHIQLEE